MKKLKKAACAAISAVLTLSSISALAYEPDIKVNLNAVSSEVSEMVLFDEVAPIQINSSTFVPARQIAESAGMDVNWDQSSQTALVTLNADANSGKPVERFAAEVINKIGGYGLELMHDNITAALKLNDPNAIIRYNFTDKDGDTVAIGKTIEMDAAATLVNDAALMIPLRNSMEIFGLDVEWNQEELTASVSIPDYITTPTGLTIIANHASREAGSAPQITQVAVEKNSPVDQNPSRGTYIGRFMITHYCPCSQCNGGWGDNTAWAGKIIPGQTIAVDPSIIEKLSWVYIEGYGLRRAEDCGGAVKGYHIDMAVENHNDAAQIGIVYRDVYYAE